VSRGRHVSGGKHMSNGRLEIFIHVEKAFAWKQSRVLMAASPPKARLPRIPLMARDFRHPRGALPMPHAHGWKSSTYHYHSPHVTCDM
jgi:hypothetical protein